MSTDPASRARAWADQYVATINAGAYDELGAQFAEEAVFLPPNGATLTGPGEIAGFYRDFLPTIRPQVRISSFLEHGREAMFVLSASTTDRPEEFVGAVDHVTLDADGRATRLVIFTRPFDPAIEEVRTEPVELTDEELVRRFPGQRIDHDNKAMFRGRLEHRLLVNRCGDCGLWHQPPMPICPRCWSANVSPTEVSGRGVIHLAVFLYQGPPAEGVDYSTPYPVVTVELDEQEGLRFTSTVVGSPNDEIRIGERVELDWIDRAGMPIPAFRLVGTAS
jgi:uncharacterized OB-fold protein